jgi:integrase
MIAARNMGSPATQRSAKMTEKLARGQWLNHAEVSRLAEFHGKHRVGPRTQLNIHRPGRGNFELRYAVGGAPRTLGLGGWPATPLGEVRAAAEAAGALLRQGIDPLARRAAEAHAVASLVSFREATERMIAARSPGWSAKHVGIWQASLATYAFPTLGDLSVAAIDTAAVLRVISPIWSTRSVTASRLRGRIESVLDYARAMGWRDGENPARWRGHMAQLLPAPGKVTVPGHYAAMDWRQVPAFMTKLRTENGIAARALEFCIMTAARSGEARGARWSEIDMGAAVWSIPAARMKAAKDHRIPLSPSVMAILHRMHGLSQAPDGLVFPGWGVSGRPLSIAALLNVLRRLGYEVSVHGFRASFSTWAAEATTHPRELVEASLAHHVGSAVERAYATDRMDRRRALMEDWAVYCGQV